MMKTILTITALALLPLSYFGYQFILATDYKLVAVGKYKHLQDASNLFTNVALITVIINLILINVLTIITKQLYWLAIPYLLAILSIVITSFFNNELFIFKKQNIGFDGSFSVGFIGAILFIVFICFIAAINYFLCKRMLHNKSKLA